MSITNLEAGSVLSIISWILYVLVVSECILHIFHNTSIKHTILLQYATMHTRAIMTTHSMPGGLI